VETQYYGRTGTGQGDPNNNVTVLVGLFVYTLLLQNYFETVPE